MIKEECGAWDYEECRRICEMAGMLEQFEKATAETFEDVVFEAAYKLGIDI